MRSTAWYAARAKDVALERAREAVACAELGETRRLELHVPARPVLEELIDEGAMDRAVLLVERDGGRGCIVAMPRAHGGQLTIA